MESAKNRSFLYNKKNLSFSLLMLAGFIFAHNAAAETFRAHSVKTVEIPDSYEKITVKCGVNDVIAVKLPEDMTFIQGIEFAIKVPQIVTYWTNSITWSIYDRISPVPDKNKIDYSANRLATGVFGTNLSLNLKLPLTSKNNIKKDAYSTVIESIPQISSDSKNSKWIFLRMMLAMKGTDDELLHSTFDVSIRPILTNNGRLIIKTTETDADENHNFSLQIDGKPFNFNGKEFDNQYLLEAGPHTLSLQSDFYRNELRTVTIAQAKTSVVEINLREITTGLKIASPEGTKIFIDDNEISYTEDFIPVTPGDHLVKFQIGNYELTKALNVTNGRIYNISINLDALITEEE